jgi:acetoin utilization deacetylase AcuC-like enzyme
MPSCARVQIFYTDQFVLPLPPGHRFPMSKYARVREQVEAAALGVLKIPDPATLEQLALAHDPDYVARVCDGRLTPAEIREIGFPWSPAMVERSLRSTGATIAASRAALADGLAVNLAGGTHHAFRGRGQGYCVFNDAAVAARVMQAEGRIRRAVIVDCDVHQGNGTAAILADDPSIFTFSIHGAHNFPFHQRDQRPRHQPARPDRRRGLPRGPRVRPARVPGPRHPRSGDLPRRRRPLPRRPHRPARPDDGRPGPPRPPGPCDMSHAGLPVAVTMAGGYARELDDVVAIHLRTVEISAALAGVVQATPRP